MTVANPTLFTVVNEYSKIDHTQKSWTQQKEMKLWEELCLCILSSNVPYEMASSAVTQLRKAQLLDLKWIIGCNTATKTLAKELKKSNYLPRKKDGSFRRYRFPNIRSRNLVEAANIIYLNDSLKKILKDSDDEYEARRFFVETIPGVGLKQASHFLRNIGYSKSLAIIDTHVISFLKEVGAIDKEVKIVTPQTYVHLEKIMCDMCNRLSLEVSRFDIAIWRSMRGKL